MDNVTVLITGAGAPGIRGTLYSLNTNLDEREIRTIGTDIRGSVVGKYLCDGFHQVPKPSDEESFVSTLMEICEREDVDVILPQVTAELEVLAFYAPNFNEKGTTVAISRTDSIRSSNNKYELMRVSKAIGVPTPEFHLEDAENALAKIAQRKPDLLITDFQMPFLSGLELCKSLRAQEETRDIPAMMLTARGFDISPEEMTQARISAVLAKPFSPREVLQKVNELLADVEAPAAAE